MDTESLNFRDLGYIVESANLDYSHVSLEVDPGVIDLAVRLLGTETDSENAAKRWIHSSEKRIMEKRILGSIGMLLWGACVPVSRAIVSITQSGNSMYRLPVGFLGNNGEIVGYHVLPKIRSFIQDANKGNTRSPFSSTAFAWGTEYYVEGMDKRVHSKFGHLLRVTGADEFPQIPHVVRGSMTGIGPRAFTIPELVGLKVMFDDIDRGELTEHNFPEDYREIVDRVRPKPGFLGLYTAIGRKTLKIGERVLLNRLYCMRANPAGDLRIFAASIKTIFQGIGAS